MQRLLRKLDPVPLAVARTACFAPVPAAEHSPRGSEGVAEGGTAHRGRLACADHAEYPVHMLSAALHDLGIVLAQLLLDHTGEKAEAERAAAPMLVDALDWTRK